MIERKPKACKGNGKAKGYESCGAFRYIHMYGLCRNCFRSWLLTEQGHEILKKSIILGTKKAKVKAKKDLAKKKIESKSIAKLIQEARIPFQKLIRIRDHGKRCICCKRPLPFNISDVDAGHFYSRESYSGLIFHPNNVHSQLKYCNQYLHGNESGYVIGLKNRIGEIAFDKLQASKNSLKTYKWNRYKLIEMKEYYTKELRLVEKGEKDINDVDLSIGIIKVEKL